jgi:hypothetical protein
MQLQSYRYCEKIVYLNINVFLADMPGFNQTRIIGLLIFDGTEGIAKKGKHNHAGFERGKKPPKYA